VAVTVAFRSETADSSGRVGGTPPTTNDERDVFGVASNRYGGCWKEDISHRYHICTRPLCVESSPFLTIYHQSLLDRRFNNI
jgi:hypothetical protein